MAEPFEVRQTWSVGRIKSYAMGILGLLAIFAFPFVFMVMAPDGLDEQSANVFAVITTIVIAAVMWWAIAAIEKGDWGFARPVRLKVFSGGFTIVPDDWGAARLNVGWGELQSIAHHKDTTKRVCLHFKTTEGTYRLQTHFLDQNTDEIMRRLELQLEQSGKHLALVDDAVPPRWNVVKGVPYDQAQRHGLLSR